MTKKRYTREQTAICAKLDRLTTDYIEMMPTRHNRNRLLNRAVELLYLLKQDYRCGNFNKEAYSNARVWSIISEGVD